MNVYPSRNSETGEVGLAFQQRKFLVKIITADSYLEKVQPINLPNESSSYFIPFLSIFNRDCNCIKIEKIHKFSQTAKINPTTVSFKYPIIAFNKVSKNFGIAFQKGSQLNSLLDKTQPFYDLLDDSFIGEDAKENHFKFLSLPNMLRRSGLKSFSDDDFESLSYENIDVYSAEICPEKSSSETLDLTEQFGTCKIANTPSFNNSVKLLSTSFVSEGLTTIATKSSCNELDVSFSSSMEVVESSNVEVDQVNIKPIKDYAYSEDELGDLRYNTILSNINNPPLSTTTREIKKFQWLVLKENFGWKNIWHKDLLSASVDTFYVPDSNNMNDRRKMKDDIQNLDYFFETNFLLHLKYNPWLYQEWFHVWNRLRKFGWEAVETYVDGNRQSCYLYTKRMEKRSLQWGVHKFNSKLAVIKYISRFPYLLQDDADLIKTVSLFHFSFSGKSIKVDEKWLNLEEFRHVCFSEPAKFFSMIATTKPAQERILKSVILDSDYAMEADREPSSPEVDGMTKSARDRTLENIAKLAEKTGEVLNALEFKKLILLVGWNHQEATWSNKWWKREKVYTPPHIRLSDLTADDGLVFGRDYFFELKDVAAYIKEDNERILIKPNRAPKKRETANFVNYNLDHFTLQRRVQKIAMNYDAGDAFTEFNLRAMLRDMGYYIVQISNKRNNKKWLYITEPAYERGVNESNYLQNAEENLDYFVDEKVLLEHLSGSNDVITIDSIPSSPGMESTVSSLSNDGSVNPKRVGKQKLMLKTPHVSSSPKVSTSIRRKWGSPDTLPPDELKVYIEVHKPKEEYSFGALYIMLKLMGWDSVWVNNSSSIICTGRMMAALNSKKNSNNRAKINREKIKDFVENEDYFNECPEGKEILLKYIRENGVRETKYYIADTDSVGPSNSPQKKAATKKTVDKPSPLIASPKPSDVIRRRISPRVGLYKAQDPAVHYNRLAMDDAASPDANEEDEQFTIEMPLHHLPENEEEDHCMELFDDENNYFDPTVFSPGFNPDDDKVMESQPTISYPDYIVDLLREDNVNPEHLFKSLKPFGWEWDYTENGVVYLAPNTKGKKERIINENYFVSKNAFIQFMKKSVGLPYEMVPPSEEKPRMTRSGRLMSNGFDPSVDTSSLAPLVLSARTTSNKRKRVESMDESVASIAEVSVKSRRKEGTDGGRISRFRLRGDVAPSSSTQVEPPMTLRGAINKAISALQVYTDFRYELQFPVLERMHECKEMLTLLLASVRSGQGNVVYLAGTAGTGKSYTANATVQFARNYILEHCDEDYPGLITCEFNATSVQKASLYEVISTEMKISESKVDAYLKKISPLDLPICEYENETTNDAMSISSQSYGKYSISKKKKDVVPMVVLIVDEFDQATPEVRKILMDWALKGRSGCFIMATGNQINLLSAVHGYATSPTEIGFSQTTVENLLPILNQRCEGLFDEVSKKWLASKVLSEKKGSIRSLMQYAQEAIDKVKIELTEEELNGPPKVIVSMKSITKLLQPKDVVVESINALPSGCTTFLVSLVLKFTNPIKTFDFNSAFQAYTFYLNKLNIPHADQDTVNRFLQNLPDSLLKEINGTHKRYQINFEVKKLLSCDSLSELLIQDLKIHLQS